MSMGLPVDSRGEVLYRLIDSLQGLHFREIARITSYPLGSVDHHLHRMVRSSRLFDQKIFNKRRYFTSSVLSEERKVIGIFRERSARELITEIERNTHTSYSSLASSLSLSKSTIQWHIARLAAEGILNPPAQGEPYSLLDPALIDSVRRKYRESLSDRMASNFISLWEL